MRINNIIQTTKNIYYARLQINRCLNCLKKSESLIDEIEN